MIPYYVAFIITLLSFGETFKPDCDVNNQFRYYCFAIEHCVSGKCDVDSCGYYFNSTLVKILYARILPKCAFADSPLLTRVIGRNQRISIVASGSFVNLPNLQEIDLSLNSITALHDGTFTNVAAHTLDLSWNKLKYIQEGALSGLRNLQYLNVSKNELLAFPVHKLPKSLIGINLSYNLLQRFAISSNRAPALDQLDVSHNLLERLALQFDNQLKKINIAGNNLDRIDYSEVAYCEEIDLTLNRFTKVPDILMISSLKRAAISPNPWKCDELEKLWPILSMNSVNVLEDQKNVESELPVCGDNDLPYRFLYLRGGENPCEVDEECNDAEICRHNVCTDPCRENICDSTKKCEVIHHSLTCSCRNTWKEDPENPQAPCQNVECFTTIDCLKPFSFCRNHTCISQPSLSVPEQDVPIGYSGYSAPASASGPARGVLDQQSPDNSKWWEHDI